MRCKSLDLAKYLPHTKLHNYILLGNEPTLFYEAYNLLKEHYQNLGYGELEQLELKNITLSELKLKLMTPSLFNPQQILVLRTQDAKSLTMLSKLEPSGLCIIVLAFDVTIAPELISELTPNYNLITALNPGGTYLKNWLRELEQRLGYELPPYWQELISSGALTPSSVHNLLLSLKFMPNADFSSSIEPTGGIYQLKNAILEGRALEVRSAFSALVQAEGLEFIPLLVWLLMKEIEHIINAALTIKVQLLTILHTLDQAVKGSHLLSSIATLQQLILQCTQIFQQLRSEHGST